ncbi:uncharacterized protein LOC133928054, partial [Phragmites australis]|uniref:uncharacterized protein LOC133928054 n=1 Tax=Phragmites australis TaxID=29695 RepID=UPI002D77A80C
PKRKRKLQPEEGQPADAMATAVQGHAGYLSLAPLPVQQPAHVVNYSVARPSTSASYYSAAAVPGAMSPAMPLPSQEYSAYYYSQPSPYRFSCGYGTPARDSYCDLFSDDNANSCTVM